MSSERYSETRTFRDESRRGITDPYNTSYNQRVSIPIQQSTSNFNSNINEQRVLDRIRQQDTTLQWVNDPISGKEKFRININIDGFNQNEVNIRVEGNKLLVNGEHLENKDQSSAKKIIEKSYELPRDIDTFSPSVTFPSSTTMLVDFPSRHTNVIIDDGRTSTNLITNYDSIHRTPPRVSQEKSSTEYTSTRKIGGTGDNSFIRSTIPRSHSPYDDLYSGNNNNFGRNNTYSSTSHYETLGNQNPLRRDYTSSTAGSYNNNTSTNPTYTYRVTTGDSQPRTTTTFPSTSLRDNNGTVHEKSFSETHREVEHRRSSPTTGVQTSREVEHQRSGSPSLTRHLDEDRFRSNLNEDRFRSNLNEDRFRSNLNSDRTNEIFQPAPTSSRNIEVREYSRRVGNTGNNTSSSFLNTEPLLFHRDFNTDAFYRSAFQPQIFTDNLGQKRIEMKLDVNNYQPNEIKVSVKDNDLIVQAEHNVERPPTSTSRAYFYKQITLPQNTDLNSLSSQYHPDGRLHITAKVSSEQTSIRYN